MTTAHSHIFEGLVCPVCNSQDITHTDNQSVCSNCNNKFPIINNVPILINEEHSIFSFNDFINQKNLFFDISNQGKFVGKIAKLIPPLGRNWKSKTNFKNIRTRLLALDKRPKVLVLGGSIIGEGMQALLEETNITFIESDVSFGPRTQVVLDAHNIPYQDNYFDCVIAQAVLEHVVNPQKCVAEIHRVLKPKGLIYAETPFMQQVHGKAYDFTRFTRSGHRSLLRNFEEIESGYVAGPGTAMAWTYEYLLLSIFGFSNKFNFLIKAWARITGFWIPFLDFLSKWNNRSIDAASGLYFIGSKSDYTLSDKEIINYYE